jgi:hypothetical protein
VIARKREGPDHFATSEKRNAEHRSHISDPGIFLSPVFRIAPSVRYLNRPRRQGHPTD